MEFSKEYFYADELRNLVTNRLKICIANSRNLPVVERPLQYCDKCNFPLLQTHCRFCHFQNSTKQMDNVLACDLKNMRFQTQADTTSFGTQKLHGKRPCYILCIDISGSMKCTYLAPSHFVKSTTQKIVETIGLEAYKHLSCYIPEQDILKNMEFFFNLLECKYSHEDIVSIYFNSNKPQGEDLEFGQQSTDAYISRKEIIYFGIKQFLENLASKDPEAIVYIVYFNNQIHVPVEDFSKYHSINDIEFKFPQQMFQLGQNYVSSIPVGPITKQKDKILDNFERIKADGQTALGPALAFCFGIASGLNRPVHQIIIITDGCSNVGFGEVQKQIPGQDIKGFYEDLTLKYGMLNSCMVNLIGFSDQKIGFDKLSQTILKTYGSANLVNIEITPTNQRMVTQQSLDNMCKQLNSYIQKVQNCCYQTRLTLVAEDEHLLLQPAANEKKLEIPRPPEFPFCLGMILGIVSPNKATEIIFLGNIPETTSSIKFSLAIDFMYRGIRYFVVNEMAISIRKGSKTQVEQELIKSLEQQLQSLKLKADVEEYQRAAQIIRQNEHLIKEDALAQFTKEMEQLKIQEVELEKAVGKDKIAVQKLKNKQE